MPDQEMVRADAAEIKAGRCPECHQDLSHHEPGPIRHHALRDFPRGPEMASDPRSDYGRRYRLLMQYADQREKDGGNQ